MRGGYAQSYSLANFGLRYVYERPIAVPIGFTSAGIFEGAKAKPRKFTETVELQVGTRWISVVV